MNNQLNFLVGISDFKKIRENDYYYIDKSGLIKELLKRESAEVTLITRPRRFGKTMGMSMLPHFFDIRSDNRRLFDGLEITCDEELCSAWMNQYPVVFLTLKDIDGRLSKMHMKDWQFRYLICTKNMHICWKVNVWIRMTGRFLKS